MSVLEPVRTPFDTKCIAHEFVAVLRRGGWWLGRVKLRILEIIRFNISVEKTIVGPGGLVRLFTRFLVL